MLPASGTAERFSRVDGPVDRLAGIRDSLSLCFSVREAVAPIGVTEIQIRSTAFLAAEIVRTSSGHATVSMPSTSLIVVNIKSQARHQVEGM